MDPAAATRRAIILAAVAGGLGRLLVDGSHLAYVRSSMFVPLVLSALAIGALALWTAFGFDEVPDDAAGSAAAEDHADHGADGHDHGGVPRVAWWLLVPFACIAIVPLRPLGASSIRGEGANSAATRSSSDADAGAGDRRAGADGAWTMLDFVSRVVNEPDRPVEDPVTLTGFVLREVDGGFVLARFVMSCCAADAQPMLVTVRTDAEVPPEDAWVTVTGTHEPAPPETPPEARIDVENIVITATTVSEVPAPREPYESP